MNKINILPKHEAQKIAAGEVVERPANIVKELLENSIDAGSKTIALYCEQAGKKLIRVVDDGCGMSPDDAQTCFLPHATSKITKLDDLQTIASFGFRGEALASISAVSKVTLKTKQHDTADELGVHVTYFDAQVQNSERASCNIGTDLSVSDLFYNVPARHKFLKRDDTEWNHIQHLFQSFCLSNLSVHFKLFRDGKMIYNAPAVKSVQDRVSQLWGYNLSQQLKALKVTREKLSIEGLISRHTFWRYGRNDIFSTLLGFTN
jgi:DNA mismatch repair protein MutL